MQCAKYYFVKSQLFSQIFQMAKIIVQDIIFIGYSYAGITNEDQPTSGHVHITVTGLVMMFVYCNISGLAGVYTEHILKQRKQVSHLHQLPIISHTIC